MKTRKASTIGLTLATLMFLGILGVLPVSLQPAVWFSYNPVTFTETTGINRTNEPVDVFFYPSPGNLSSADEIRVVAPDKVTEVPSQVYNVTMESGYVKSCNVVFRVNCTAYSSVTYYIVYNDPGAPPPSYPTDLKLKTVPRGGVTEITARVSNAKYSAYIGREGSIGGTETGKHVYIKDWNPSQNIFQVSGSAWIPWAKYGTYQPWFLDYDGSMTLVRNGSIFVDLDAAAIWKEGAQKALSECHLINFTSKLRFYAHNSWFTNTLTAYTQGDRSYTWLKPSVATDQAYMALAVYRYSNGTRAELNVNQGFGVERFSTDWDGKWVDYANSSAANNDHGFAILQLPGGTPFTGLMKAAGSTGPRYTGDSWDMYWNGSGAVFTANLVLGFHANSNYTYAEDLYDQLTNSLQSTLEVGGENDNTNYPSFTPPVGWSDYTPINVTETIGKARTFEPVDVFFTPGANKISKAEEIRVYDSSGVEIPSQVYNTTLGGSPPNQYISSLSVVFLANVTANTETTYYIAYNNPSVTTLPAWYKTWSDLSVTTQPLTYKPGYYTVDAANTYYNSTGETWGSGAMSSVKVLGYSSTLDVMASVFLPAVRLPGMPYGEGYFGFWSLSGNTTIIRNGSVFADVLTTVSDFGLAQGFRTSGVNNYTIMLRYYAYTPWVTATITYNANGTVNYELMEIGVKVPSTPEGRIITTASAEGLPWLTRPNAVGTIQTFNMSLKPGNVTTDSGPRNLAWAADWDQTWVGFQNSTASNNPVGCALINLNGAGTTSFVGLKSEGGNEGSPYWNGTCTTKTAKLAVGFHTGSNYTYAQNLYTRLSNPLTVVIGQEASYIAKFSHPGLLSIYNVSLDVNRTFFEGTSLVVKFYSYGGVYQGESTVWTGTTPTVVTLSQNMTHPQGEPIENATLVLGDAGGNSTVSSFVMRRSHLITRLATLDTRWALGYPKPPIFLEIIDIDAKWPYAPP